MIILQSEDQYSLAGLTATHQKLPVGTYIVQFSDTRGYYLVRKEDFKLPSKTYGDFAITDRWIKSYQHNSEKNLGIILSGIKGSGKTITAQKFCIDSGLPVIMLTNAWSGAAFTDFITSPVFNNCIIFIDEFEKVYPDHNDPDGNNPQKDLLSLMDGNFPTKLIFLLTVNEFHINEYLINRLNRIKYRKHYDSIEQDVMDQVIDDLLSVEYLKYRNTIYDFFDKLGMCTFDLLVNLIKEMNLFGEDALQCAKHLNLRGEARFYHVYEIVGEEEHQCASVTLSPDQTELYIERKKIDYLPKKRQNWDLYVSLGKCEIEKKNKDMFIATDIENKTTLKFVAQPRLSMLF
jgi:hypothetical protein